ncbi:MAG: hypothetical protein HY282_15890 [Nitrospirae bacterium]|nr:hypothetical protein [Candidatus Manganitrophaceae bacterium]
MYQKNLMVLDQGREGLGRLTALGTTYNLVLIHEASDALSFLQRIPVDVILLRDQMSGMDALEFLMNLHDLHTSAMAVVLYHDRFPALLPEMPELANVCFLREPISSDDLNRLITQLESAGQTERTH